MNIIHPSENCKSWILRPFDNICEELQACTACSSDRSFTVKDIHFIWRWDIDIPQDWRWGDWDQIRLHTVKVPIILVQCADCRTPFVIYPSFIIGGTTLTIQALMMVAFAYEYSLLTWRGMVEHFCDESDRIAHSTLYRAVHSIGLLLVGNAEAYRVAEEYLNNFDIPGFSKMPWPPLKSRYEHTRERESCVRDILQLLLCILSLSPGFIHAFFRYLKNMHLFFKNLNSPLAQLYGKKTMTCLADTS